MSDKKITSTDALDEVEEKLNLKQPTSKAPDGDHVDEESQNDNVKERQSGKIASLLKRVMLKIKQTDFSVIKNKFHLNDARKEKLKRFSTSNLGITTIVLTIVILFIGINVIRRHHSSQSAPSSNASWSTSNTNQKTSDVSSQTLAQKSDSQTAPMPSSAGVTSAQLTNMMQTLSDLTDQMKSLNQRMMVISQELTNKSHHAVINRKYRILGWRLDQDTNQWVADIEYNGQVKAYYAGQHFGKWVVRNITANGVKVR
jgi:hypothetical protein